MGGSRMPCLRQLVGWSSLAVALSVWFFGGVGGEGTVAPYPAAQWHGCRSSRLWLIQD